MNGKRIFAACALVALCLPLAGCSFSMFSHEHEHFAEDVEFRERLDNLERRVHRLEKAHEPAPPGHSM